VSTVHVPLTSSFSYYHHMASGRTQWVFPSEQPQPPQASVTGPRISVVPLSAEVAEMYRCLEGIHRHLSQNPQLPALLSQSISEHLWMSDEDTVPILCKDARSQGEPLLAKLEMLQPGKNSVQFSRSKLEIMFFEDTPGFSLIVHDWPSDCASAALSPSVVWECLAPPASSHCFERSPDDPPSEPQSLPWVQLSDADIVSQLNERKTELRSRLGHKYRLDRSSNTLVVAAADAARGPLHDYRIRWRPLIQARASLSGSPTGQRFPILPDIEPDTLHETSVAANAGLELLASNISSEKVKNDALVKMRMVDAGVQQNFDSSIAVQGTLESASLCDHHTTTMHPMAELWNLLIATSCFSVAEKEEKVDRMLAAGLQPNIRTWNQLVAGYSTAEAKERVVFRMRDAGVHPNEATWSHLFEDHSSVVDIEGLVQRLVEAGVQLNAAGNLIIAKKLAAARLLKENVQPNADTWSMSTDTKKLQDEAALSQKKVCVLWARRMCAQNGYVTSILILTTPMPVSTWLSTSCFDRLSRICHI
jgi:hypothetical protein